MKRAPGRLAASVACATVSTRDAGIDGQLMRLTVHAQRHICQFGALRSAAVAQSWERGQGDSESDHASAGRNEHGATFDARTTGFRHDRQARS